MDLAITSLVLPLLIVRFFRITYKRNNRYLKSRQYTTTKEDLNPAKIATEV